jgi:ubiquinone/menaquinone biosynthesis C-methylase UbiE
MDQDGKMTKKRVLNVGGNSKAIPLPPQYAGFEHLLLDIDEKASPDILCDARKLDSLEAGQFDAIYCSHTLEHFYPHDVPKVLSGFLHVLNDDGFAQIIVPDIMGAMQMVVQRNMDIEDVLYVSPAGPITLRDMLYSYSVFVEKSPEFMSHKTGFSPKSLVSAVGKAGFKSVLSASGNFNASVLAFKNAPTQAAMELFNLPNNP